MFTYHIHSNWYVSWYGMIWAVRKVLNYPISGRNTRAYVYTRVPVLKITWVSGRQTGIE